MRVLRNLAKANAVAYDAVPRNDRRARVGPVHNMIAFTAADPADAFASDDQVMTPAPDQEPRPRTWGELRKRVLEQDLVLLAP